MGLCITSQVLHNRVMEIDEFIQRRTRQFSLQDGTQVLLRPIIPDDKQRLIAAFERLSPESRYRRFMAPFKLTPSALAYLTEVDYVNHFAWAALAVDEEGQPGIGVARYVRFAADPSVAEAAVTVIDEYQGRGLGSLLLKILAITALENGVETFRAFVLSENRSMLEMLRSMDSKIEHEGNGLLRMDLDLPKQIEKLKGSPMYALLREAAAGQIPVVPSVSMPDLAQN